MARRVYFSFHYEGDVWRTNQVRNSWVTKPDREAAGFHDKAEFEKVQREGAGAVSRWINENLDGTSVTVVCIGEHTCERHWVREEIKRSEERGNGIIFVRVHKLKDQDQQICSPGKMDFGDDIDTSKYPVYDYVKDNGYENLGDWVDASAIAAGREDLGPPSRRYGKPHGCGRS